MIVIEEQNDLLKATVYAELSLADFREFETAVQRELKQAPKIKLLLDLSNMSGYTLDVAWEDVRFTRAHAHDFRRIAVVRSHSAPVSVGIFAAACAARSAAPGQLLIALIRLSASSKSVIELPLL